MSQNRTQYYFILTVGFLLVGIGLSMIFQNCGSDSSTSPQNYSLYSSAQQKFNSYVQNNKSKITVAACQKETAYRCEHEIFYPGAQRKSEIGDFNCVEISNNRFCPEGTVRIFDNSGANNKSRYETFNCYFNLMGLHGDYPLQGTSNDLMSAIEIAHLACMKAAQ